MGAICHSIGMMKTFRMLFLICLCGLPVAGLSQDRPPLARSEPQLTLADVADRIGARYRGRLLAVTVTPPRILERAMGVRTVFEARYLTLQDNVLTIRLDGDRGLFLLIDGAGQTAARIRP